jgi:hypothetical protein
VVVVGACGVGKTTWISRLKSKNPKKYKMSKEDHEFPTVGAEVTTIEMPTSRGTKKKPHSVTLKVWEVSGSDDQAGIRPTYYSGAHAAVILFKVASNSETTKAPLQTYWEVLRWHNEVVQACGKDLPIIVVRHTPITRHIGCPVLPPSTLRVPQFTMHTSTRTSACAVGCVLNDALAWVRADRGGGGSRG